MRKIKLLALMAVCASAFLMGVPNMASAQVQHPGIPPASPTYPGTESWCDNRESYCTLQHSQCSIECAFYHEGQSCYDGCDSWYNSCMATWYNAGCNFYE